MWWKNSNIQGVKYDVKVIGQLFLDSRPLDPSRRGSCLPTSFEMAAWHLKHKQLDNGGGEFSILGNFTVSPDQKYPKITNRSRLGSITTYPDSIAPDNDDKELVNKYYWNQPMLHLFFHCSVSKMIDFVNKSAIDMGIWDYCEGRNPTPEAIQMSLSESQRVPILTFSYPRPDIEIDPSTNRVRSIKPHFWEEERHPSHVDRIGHAVVITGWRNWRNKSGSKELEFLVNDPGPGADIFQGLTKTWNQPVSCGSQYWISQSDLFDLDWNPKGLYEVYSNPDMLAANDGGINQNLYLPEYYVTNMKLLKDGKWIPME